MGTLDASTIEGLSLFSMVEGIAETETEVIEFEEKGR